MESKQCSPEKKSKKRGRTKPEPQPEPQPQPQPRGVVRCSSSVDEEKRSWTMMEAATELDPERRGLVRCSSASSENEGKNKSRYGSLKPLITTVTKTTTTSITIITPPEDPNNHIHIYICIRTGIDLFSWFKIDPSNKTVKPPKPKSSDNNNSKGNLKKEKKKKQPILLTPISRMPHNTPDGFRVIPHSSSSKQKLVYAVGGARHSGGPASKAFVCDFASTTDPPVWIELPPLPLPMKISIGVASPLDGQVYAFGITDSKAPRDPNTYMGLVFDPSSSSSTSWNPCPHPYDRLNFGYYTISINDYALIDTENGSQLCVFTSSKRAHPFNLTTAQWERTLYTPIPTNPLFPVTEVSSTSVGVGHLIFKFHNQRLFALDSSSPQPFFKPVPGLDNKLPKYREVRGSGRMVYLGKGKLCIVWGHDSPPHEANTLYITCLKFWIGMCNRRNQLRAVIDRHERFVAHGCRVYEVIAL